MSNNFPGGVWPVMLTPFTKENQVDYQALGELIAWYKKEGVSGFFAVCQSSEMFFLSLEERVKIARFVKEQAGDMPVVASGHVSDAFEDQVAEIQAIGETGVDAVILITNRLAKEEESDEVWLENLKKLLAELPEDVKLGFYECPYPYKRVMTAEMTKWCADSGRFYFLKDTCCDLELIKKKLAVLPGTNLKLYNANVTTLLDSLKAGAAGFSGVMANMQCSLYAKLCADFKKQPLEDLMDELDICALIERQVYPINAKYYLQLEGLHFETKSRTRDENELNETLREEVRMLRRVTERMKEKWM